MSEIFITSDTHFSHDKDFLWRPRDFTSIKEMNEAIVERWNSVIKSKDRVIHLGDIILNNTEEGLKHFKRLNGQICIVWGNHDSPTRQKELEKLSNVIILGYAHYFKYNKINIYLSHYPTLTANYDEKHFSQHVINFHGHLHTKEKWSFNSPFLYNVCMDAHNCYPIHIEDAISDCRKKFLLEKSEKSE